MSGTLQRLDQVQVSELAVSIRNAGIAGAGGAGFPTYAKWERIDEVSNLLVNHQESEPNYYMDKWLGQSRAGDLDELFDALSDSALDVVVIAAKESDRDRWMGELEATLGGTIYLPDELPIDAEDESGVVFAYTDDRYEFGMESVLLNMVAETVIGRDLPMDHGWIVQNTETLLAMYDALLTGQAMTHKHVHVDGHVPQHRFLEVPIGTPIEDILSAAGMSSSELPADAVVADGGPGWCFAIEEPLEQFGIRKRSNCLLVLTEQEVKEHTLGNGRIDLRDLHPWKSGDHESAPTGAITPDHVNIPLITNPAFEGVVEPSKPIVSEGESVEAGEMIAVPAPDGISIPQHTSISGEVMSISDDWITIEHREPTTAVGRTAKVEPLDRLYWTWCQECGEYVIPEATVVDPETYICADCI